LKTSARGFGFAKSLSYIHGIEKMVMKKIVISIAIIVTAVTAKVGHSEYQQWKQIKEQRDQVGLEIVKYTIKYNDALVTEQQSWAKKIDLKIANIWSKSLDSSKKELEYYNTQLNQGFWGTIFTTFN
jgi:hypothetical protein